jgi:hypothetical protein
MRILLCGGPLNSREIDHPAEVSLVRLQRAGGFGFHTYAADSRDTAPQAGQPVRFYYRGTTSLAPSWRPAERCV